MAELKRSIGLARGTFMMLNIVLGAGLLTLPGLAAQSAGSAAPWIWVTCALVAVPLLAVFAILGRDHPSSGGIPAWVRTSFGDWAYIPSILLFLGAVSVGLPSIAMTGGHYASAIFGGDVHLLAAGLIAGATLVNLVSAEVAGRINAAIASMLLFVLVGMAIVGLATTDVATATSASLAAPVMDISTFGVTFMMIFFAFTGWEVAANLAGEFKSPERTFPWAVALSFLAAVTLYLALAFVVLAAGPSAHGPAPFAAIFSERFGEAGAWSISLIATLLVFANLSAAIWAVSRLVFSVSQDMVLPAALAHVTRGVPLRAVLTTTAVLLLVTALSGNGAFSLSVLLEAAGQNFLLLYGAAAAALITLGRRKGHKVLGVVSIGLVTALLASRPIEALNYPLALVLVGLIIAMARTRRRRVTGT